MSKILVADDEPAFRRLVADCLAEEGFEVLEAANGLEALLQIKRERPRVVLLDLRMPRLGGLGVLERVRRFDRAIRVLIVTGFPEDVGGGVTSLGATAVLLKPGRARASRRGHRHGPSREPERTGARGRLKR